MKAPNLISLDVLRGLACLLVWMSHVRMATRYFADSNYDFIQVFSAWGRESVVVFFMLSGILINLSSQQKTSRGQYFLKRFLRIYPIYLVVLIICFVSDHLIFGHTTDTFTLIGNLLVSGTIHVNFIPTMPLNSVVWSITSEVFFYLIFGLIFTLNRIKLVWIWFVLCCFSIMYKTTYGNMFNNGLGDHFILLINTSFVWILGYLVFEYRDKFTSSLPVALCGVLLIPSITRLHNLPADFNILIYSLPGICLSPLFIYLLRNYKTSSKEKFSINYWYVAPVYAVGVIMLWQYSNSTMLSKILYSVLPLCSVVLFSKLLILILQRIYFSSKSFFVFFANISYPLYLVHVPIMYIVYHYLPGHKTIGSILIILLTITISYFFELYLFKKPALILPPSRITKIENVKEATF